MPTVAEQSHVSRAGDGHPEGQPSSSEAKVAALHIGAQCVLAKLWNVEMPNRQTKKSCNKSTSTTASSLTRLPRSPLDDLHIYVCSRSLSRVMLSITVYHTAAANDCHDMSVPDDPHSIKKLDLHVLEGSYSLGIWDPRGARRDAR